MKLLNAVERRLSPLAIPGLIRFLAMIQLLAFVLQFVNPDLRSLLALDLGAILNGEVWRTISFVFVPFGNPQNVLSMLFAVFGAMLLIAFGDGLEQRWGVFRTNLYVFYGWLMNLGATLGFQYWGIDTGQHPYAPGLMLDASILFAFATLYPRFTIQLFFVLPVPIFIVALLTALPMVLGGLASLPAALYVIACQANYLTAVVPERLRHGRQQVAASQRRSAYRRKRAEVGPTLHRCAVCDRTEASDPQLDFRVSEDGQEYCEEHLPEASSVPS